MRNKKNSIIAIMVIVMLVMATGYAYFATRLSINATGSIDGSWNVYFSKIEVGTKSTGASTKGTPSVSNTTANMDVSLKAPGDYINFNITLVNGGSVDAIIEDIEAREEGTSAIVFSISGIKIGDKLAGGSNASKVITIRMEYSASVTSQPTELTKRLTVDIDAVQDIGQTITSKDPIITSTLSSKILSGDVAYATNASSPYVTASTGIDFSQPSSDENGKGLYYAQDDLGTSYFFRGDVDNNYVEFGTINYYDDWKMVVFDTEGSIEYSVNYETSFNSKEDCENSEDFDDSIMECRIIRNYGSGSNVAPMYWRIVRINGDNSIRLIFDGVEKLHNGTPRHTIIDSIVYDDVEDVTYITPDVIKFGIAPQSWYSSILETNFGKYIEDGIFCNDTEIAETIYYNFNEDTYELEVTEEETDLADYLYAGGKRLNKNPKLTCTNKSDRFTINTTIGNGKLNKPIGIINADEVVMAGLGVNSYIYSGEMYWTSTPYDYYVWETAASMAEIASVSSDGSLFVSDIWGAYGYGRGIRPVINLKADVVVTGNGTIDSPYVVQYN